MGNVSGRNVDAGWFCFEEDGLGGGQIEGLVWLREESHLERDKRGRGTIFREIQGEGKAMEGS